MKKTDAIATLQALGKVDAAKELDSWRSKDGDNKGWDGPFYVKYPELKESRKT